MWRNEDEFLRENLVKFFNQVPPSITILVVGKTGVGKSSLVNRIIGEKVAEEGAGVDSCTTSLAKYESTIRCQSTKTIRITVWDSPGHEDVEGEDGNDDYFMQMKTLKERSNIDLLLFCIQLSERRWRKDDEKAMKAIHRAFGPSIWNKAMIALTQANDLRDCNGPLTRAAYDEKVRQWTHKIDSVLQRLGVQEKVAAIPTGNFVDKSLPNTDDWFSDFWLMAFSSICPDKRVALWHMNEPYIRFSSVRDRASWGSAESYTGGRSSTQRCTSDGSGAQRYQHCGGRVHSYAIDLSGERGKKVKKSFLESIGNFLKNWGVPLLKIGVAVASALTGGLPGVIGSLCSFFS